MSFSSISREKLRIDRIRRSLGFKTKPSRPTSFVKVKKKLLEHSFSKDIDEARKEWTYTGFALVAGDDDFFPLCQLCGQTNLLVTFRISNKHTDVWLDVGPNCIHKFLLLDGASSSEESSKLFNGQVGDSIRIPELRVAYHIAIESPSNANVKQFNRLLDQMLKDNGYERPSMNSDISHIIAWIFGEEVTNDTIHHMDRYYLNSVLHPKIK